MTPRGFWSYARGDDAHLDNLLTRLRGRVAGEISMLLGQDLDMFQDVHDIRTGDDWEDKLKSELTDASFMVPVLTPRYFTRPWCREEVMTFLRLAERAGVKPLLFPIYFVEDRPYERGDPCEVRAAVRRYQHFDYRPLRFESDPTRLDKAVHDFANDVVDGLEAEEPNPRPARKKVEEPQPILESGTAKTSEDGAPSQSESASPASPVPEVPTLVVDPWPNRGDFETIGAAIEAAERGSRVLIRPGTYDEQLLLDKPLELIGDGDAAEIVVRTSTGHTLQVSANIAEIANLSLFRDAGERKDVALWVTSGRAVIRDCVFSGRSISAVDVMGAGTAPEFRRCRFIDSAELGMLVCENARPRLEDCEMIGNGYSGVGIKTGADPVLRRCVLLGNTHSGAVIYQEGRGILEDCTLRDNVYDGVAALEGGVPVVRRCTIAANGRHAVWVGDSTSGGTFEDNDLRGNAGGPWSIVKGAEVNLIRRGNKE